MPDLPFLVDRAAATKLQRVLLWGGLACSVVFRTMLHSDVADPDEAVEIADLEVSFSIEPGGSTRPEPVLRPEAFAATRLGQWALLRMVLPAGTPLFVAHATVGSVAYVGGDDSTRVLASRLGELVRPFGVRFHVLPFTDRPARADLPSLSVREMLHALTVSPISASLAPYVCSLLPAVTGLEFRTPEVPDILVHVRSDATPVEIGRVARVLPEIVTPGFRPTVVADGSRTWRNV